MPASVTSPVFDLKMIDDGGYVLLAVPKGIWLEVIHIPETADNTQQEAE